MHKPIRFETDTPHKKLAGLWNSEPHREFRVPASRVQSLLTPQGQEQSPNPVDEIFKLEFIELGSKTIQRLSQNEDVADRAGVITYIRNNIKRNYTPFVALNLTLLTALEQKNATASALLGNPPVDHGTAHWTSLMVDIAAAERLFANDRKHLIQYLIWRKTVERTDVQHNQLLDTSGQSSHQQSAVPTTPGTTPLTLELPQAGSNEVNVKESLMRTDLGNWLAILERDIASNDDFDPVQMLAVIDQIESTFTGLKPSVPLRLDLRDQPLLDRQAYLLSLKLGKYIVTESDGTLSIKKHCLKTLQAVRRAITVHATRHRIMGNDLGIMLHQTMRETDPRRILSPVEEIINSVDLVDTEIRIIDEARGKISIAIDTLVNALRRDQYEIVPQHLTKQNETLMDAEQILRMRHRFLRGW